MLTPQDIDRLFAYDAGILRWKISIGHRGEVGAEAGTLLSKGYRRIKVQGRWYLTHRLIFTLHHWYTPEEVDHIDGDKLNNKIENLRAATRSENQRNKPLTKNNTSGIKNVSWWKKYNKWRVQIRVGGLKKHIGSYDDIELAELVAIETRNKYHKEFANHG